jgi:hypothetical protein
MADQDLTYEDSATGSEITTILDKDIEQSDSGTGVDFQVSSVDQTTKALAARDDGHGTETYRINTGVDRQAQRVRARIHRYRTYARLHNTMEPTGTERETGFESWDG